MTARCPGPAEEVRRWRSILFVPVLNGRYVEKACSSGAHAIQLDLEDSIRPADKEKARASLPGAALKLRQAGKPFSVRVNQPLELAVPDMQAAVAAGAHAVMLPKVLGASHVRLLDELAGRLERNHGRPCGALRFVVVIETPDAYHCMREIFSASPRIAGAMLGSEDFARACGCDPGEDTMRGYKMEMVVAACAAGVNPMGTLGSIADFADAAAYEAMVRRSKSAGFRSTTCIHPSQVEVVNRVYGRDEDAVEYARRIVAAAEQAHAQGRGAFQLDGRMVDSPVIARARQVLRDAGDHLQAP